MVVENVETLDVGWCVCVWVGGGSLPELPVRSPVCSGGLTHMKHNPWEATDTFP